MKTNNKQKKKNRYKKNILMIKFLNKFSYFQFSSLLFLGCGFCKVSVINYFKHEKKFFIPANRFLETHLCSHKCCVSEKTSENCLHKKLESMLNPENALINKNWHLSSHLLVVFTDKFFTVNLCDILSLLRKFCLT